MKFLTIIFVAAVFSRQGIYGKRVTVVGSETSVDVHEIHSLQLDKLEEYALKQVKNDALSWQTDTETTDDLGKLSCEVMYNNKHDKNVGEPNCIPEPLHGYIRFPKLQDDGEHEITLLQCSCNKNKDIFYLVETSDEELREENTYFHILLKKVNTEIYEVVSGWKIQCPVQSSKD